jgi:hypothetical protein
MILKKFEYSEFTGEPNAWSLKGLVLENINLLVGKNATGKTNTLRRISWLGDMLADRVPPSAFPGEYVVEITDNNIIYNYELKIESGYVEHEKLTVDGVQIFERRIDVQENIAAIQFPDSGMNFQLHPNQLVVTVKRDAYQHPFLEKLAQWAEGQRVYEFGLNMGKKTSSNVEELNMSIGDPRYIRSIVDLYRKGVNEFFQDFNDHIIDSMKKIGYELKEIGDSSITGQTSGLELYIIEKNSETKIYQSDMSQGMFRALSLIIHIIYNSLKNIATTILIDDIGEGLDFERSSKLIKLLIKLAEENDTIQLIMSTNDRFVMNNVSLKYWQVIQRNGGECTVFNYQNSKDIFDEFEYTGLNNFDFLTTDFINSQEEFK